MRQSQLFTRTRKENPADEVAKNAQLLIRAGFIYKEMAGVYAMLPLGLRVINKIRNIVRSELDAIGCQELALTALQQSDKWEKSGRWDESVVDDWFKTELKNGSKLGLGFTHEEAITTIMKESISSYRDLPVYAYQFQTKFRNEKRAKSGLLRGREFEMKDLYNFSRDRAAHEAFYEKVKQAYINIFNKVGIGDQTFVTISSGGSFSKYSFEFQTITDAGEDTIMFNREQNISINKDDFSEELLKDFNVPEGTVFEEATSVEVGDIYTLGDKFSKALDLTYRDEKGEEQYVFMGSYGIGIPRLMGTSVEVFSDEKGIVWPESIAPFAVHLIALGEKGTAEAEEIYKVLLAQGVEVLFDDRTGVTAGEKFADADLIGIPHRVVVSDRSLAAGGVEYKKRTHTEAKIITTDELYAII